MKLKLVSDGTPQGSNVVIAETGQVVENVEVVDLRVDAKAGVTGTLRFIFLQVDVAFTGPKVVK